MSQQALDDILRKASSDAGFRSRLRTDFDATVKTYDLSGAERQQLRASSDIAGVSKEAPVRRAAASSDALLSKEEALLSKEEALLSKEEALLSKEEALLSKDEALLSKDEALLSKDEALLNRGDTVM